MRESFSSLTQTAQDFCVDDSVTSTSGLSSTITFLKREINNSVRFAFSLMKEYGLRPLPLTTPTVAGQIYYHMPPGLSKIQSVTITVGTRNIPLVIVESQDEWDDLQEIPIAGSFPTRYFPRRDDLGIYPTPTTVQTITVVGNFQPVNMVADDNVDGTVSIGQNSLTLTGTNTTFSAPMVGRWFSPTDSTTGVSNGNWYRLGAFSSTTSMTLETYFEDSALIASTYLIGESPEIPSELHEFIPYRAAAIYYGTRRKDKDQSQRLMNYFYTGDFDNTTRRGTIQGGVLGVYEEMKERGRDNSQVVEMGPTVPYNAMRFGSWGGTITET